MKHSQTGIAKKFLFLMVGLLMAIGVNAQSITVSGTVTDPSGEPLIGASVLAEGTTAGASTDIDGNYTIKVAPEGVLVVSYVGYDTQRVPVEGRTTINVEMKENSVMLNEVVAIGYGVVKKQDATGSVAVIKPDEVEAGLATSVQDMLVGQTPGVVVTTSGGPEGAANIRIRGGSSLNAKNDPLIVIDGVPLDNNGVKGMSNPLAMINPNNVESMTVLKDASATAIYGSRASNGVIIITTKKGTSGRPKVSFAANMYINTAAKTWDVLSSGEFESLVRDNNLNPERLGYNGQIYDTDWQNEVLRTTVSSDYSLSVSGTAGILPYRADVSYTNSNGILKGTKMDRVTVGFSLSPKFFDNHLSVNANALGFYAKNQFTDQAAVGAALAMDPTKPVYSNIPVVGNTNQQYLTGGFFTWMNTGSDGTVTIDQNATRNPVSYFEGHDNNAKVYRSNGNLQLDYSFHFLPELHANLNLGYDVSKTDEHDSTEAGNPNTYWSHRKDGAGFTNYTYQFKSNTLLDFYLNYRKEFEAIKSNLDVTAGYSWQRNYLSTWHYGADSESGRPTTAGFNTPVFANGVYTLNYNPSTEASIGQNFANDIVDPEGNYHYKEHLQLLSFFGRVNYTFAGRYLLTATVRGDATSRFSKDNRWGVFPAVALGWRIIDESFMEGTRGWLNDLKLRLGWGMTGQQEVGSTCNYLPLYSIAGPGSYYPVVGSDGKVIYAPSYFLKGYNPDLKWETTTTWNAGIDFAFFNNRISGSFDWYLRKTKDLLSYVTIPAGSSTVNMLNRNIGDLENYGVEFNIVARPVVTNDFNWTIAYNVGYNHNEIKSLNDPKAKITTGGISGGTGNTVQAQAVGTPANAFYLLQQVYDNAGNPIEGVFVDQDGNGVINSDDKVVKHSPDPKVTMTMTNNFRWKNWDLGISLRASLGNYVYNNTLAQNSSINDVNKYGLTNIVKTDFYWQNKAAANFYMSDYFLENASFLRCDNITLGYTWDNLLKGNLNLRLFGAVQNPFVITKYSGIDPEVFGGIDNNVYPRSTTYSLGLVATF